jgi:hypothetical protein
MLERFFDIGKQGKVTTGFNYVGVALINSIVIRTIGIIGNEETYSLQAVTKYLKEDPNREITKANSTLSPEEFDETFDLLLKEFDYIERRPKKKSRHWEFVNSDLREVERYRQLISHPGSPLKAERTSFTNSQTLKAIYSIRPLMELTEKIFVNKQRVTSHTSGTSKRISDEFWDIFELGLPKSTIAAQ